ncbi:MULTISPECIES: hypothetical protein [unclassified Mesorhizobium]|uniref:hypothetical protein n=1 Tax=unclassified Mesorhizobium TaxID=325217 RepID=UPI0019D4D199|nr:hypothetical protein [Mesorhizobium sp. M6A.T.Cr.TU.017.01.1.1]
MLQFSEYAEVAIPNTWGKGWRNPVRYTTLEDLGIDVNGLVFQPMPEPTPGSEVGTAQSGAASEEGGQPLKLTIAEAKEGLSAMFGVPVEAVEITIRA